MKKETTLTLACRETDSGELNIVIERTAEWGDVRLSFAMTVGEALGLADAIRDRLNDDE